MAPTSRNASGVFSSGGLLSGLVAALLLGACAGPAETPLGGALAPNEPANAARQGAQPPADLAARSAAHAADPGNATAALAYARALRASQSRQEAMAVLDKAGAAKPADRKLQLERGLLALELGDTGKAEKLLRQAQDPKAPDWRLHSGLGAVLASGGRQREAQAEFAKALALAPDHPSVLNNLALSYALDGKTEDAEKILRKAQRGGGKAPPAREKVQENLALVVGLRGRYDEARSMAKTILPPAAADGNVAYLQRLAKAQSAAPADRAPEPAAERPARKTNASLPQPVYQLGGP